MIGALHNSVPEDRLPDRIARMRAAGDQHVLLVEAVQCHALLPGGAPGRYGLGRVAETGEYGYSG